MLKFLTAITVMILAHILRAWAVVLLWNWFVLPTFTTAPHLNYPVALGLSMLVGYMVNANPSAQVTKEEEEKSFTNKVLTALLTPVVIVFSGWVFTLFM